MLLHGDLLLALCMMLNNFLALLILVTGGKLLQLNGIWKDRASPFKMLSDEIEYIKIAKSESICLNEIFFS